MSLELGGKSPNIVFDDVNIKEVVEICNDGLFFNNGKCCNAGNIIYVH